jgi:dihydroorotase
MATVNAARLLGRSNELGSIQVGRPAEISVLKRVDREWEAVDSQRGKLPAHQALVPVFAIRNSAVYEPLPSERP